MAAAMAVEPGVGEYWGGLGVPGGVPGRVEPFPLSQVRASEPPLEPELEAELGPGPPDPELDLGGEDLVLDEVDGGGQRGGPVLWGETGGTGYGDDDTRGTCYWGGGG